MTFFPVHLNGKSVQAATGETILEVAGRHGLEIPTLCHDPRLEPAGACRTCLVEIEGWRRLAPACATKVAADMNITTENSTSRANPVSSTSEIGCMASDSATVRAAALRFACGASRSSATSST